MSDNLPQKAPLTFSMPNNLATLPTQYIAAPHRCELTATAKSNIEKVRYISIDSWPNVNHTYFKYINYTLQLPAGSTIEPKYCQSHCDYVITSALGLNSKGIPSLTGIGIDFRPALDCNGSGYEPNLIAALQDAIQVATANDAKGIKTIMYYAVLGVYNTQQKLDLLTQLASIESVYLILPIGNGSSGDQYDYCTLAPLETKGIYIIGGTVGGNKLDPISNCGNCVNYYLPSDYVSVLTGKRVHGVSFAGGILAYLMANFFLNNPDATRAELNAHLDSLTDTVVGKTTYGNISVNMKVFRKSSICSMGMAVVASEDIPNLIATNGFNGQKLKFKQS